MLFKAYIAGLIACLCASSAWAGQLDASWSAPTTNTDGSALDPATLTYRVYYFLFPNTPCPGTQFLVTNQGVTTMNIPGLTQGMTYNVAATAVAPSGNESACSNVASGVARADSGSLPLAASNVKLVFAQGPAQGGTVNFGDQTIEATSTSNLGGLLDAQPATLPVSGTLQSLAVYVATAGGHVTLGLYDATGANAGPGKLLATTQVLTPVVGWNIAPTMTTPSLQPGNYWLAVTVDSNGLALRRSSSGTMKRGFSFTLPSTFPAIQASPAQTYSMYGTVTTP